MKGYTGWTDNLENANIIAGLLIVRCSTEVDSSDSGGRSAEQRRTGREGTEGERNIHGHNAEPPYRIITGL